MDEKWLTARRLDSRLAQGNRTFENPRPPDSRSRLTRNALEFKRPLNRSYTLRATNLLLARRQHQRRRRLDFGAANELRFLRSSACPSRLHLLAPDPIMKPRPTFYILDAYSLIYQVFHAIPLMTSPAGQPTQAVFGIFRDLLNLNRDRKPDYLAAAFDGPGPVFRSELYADYKANRAAMPDDLVPQIPVIRRVFEGFRVPVLTQEGMEADDVIATLARRGAERGLDVFICTADKDARQLLDDQIRIYNLRKQYVLDVAALKADWGVGPEQVVDLLALTGDTSDNVPGVPGIGLKTGAKLLEEFGTLEDLLANVEQGLRCQAQGEPRRHRETARLARKLVVLRDDLRARSRLGRAAGGTARTSRRSRRLCIECGFHRFLDELATPKRQEQLLWSEAEGETVAGALHRPARTRGPRASRREGWQYDYQLVDTPE